MGMDTGAVAGKGKAVRMEKAVFQGGDEGGKTKEELEPFFIMKGKLLMGEVVSGDGIRDASMFIGKLLSPAWLLGRHFVFVSGKKIFPAGFLGVQRLSPEPVHEVKIRAKWRQGIRCTADENGKETVSPEFLEPGSKAGKAEHQHEDKGADDLGLVFGRPASVGIESGKEFHGGIQIQQPEFFPYSFEFKAEP